MTDFDKAIEEAKAAVLSFESWEASGFWLAVKGNGP
jgi:hypothetical protein